MCQQHDGNGRHGSRLADGEAHAKDHSAWSRRDFLGSLGLTAAAGTLAMSGVPVRAFARTSMLHRLASVETDRILVILQLAGGNDGLNTVVPYRNDIYFNARPAIAINNSLALSDDYGLHPIMSGLSDLYQAGRMGVVHSVGYPEADLSHFRSTDIWMTGGDGSNVPVTGWAGRYLDDAFPGYTEAPSDYPLAVQLGGGAPLMFQGPGAQMGMSVASMELFDQLAETGKLYKTDDLPDTRLGGEISFLRSVANDSFRFADAIQDASSTGGNQADYITPNPLAEQLAAVARLIRGGLGTRIYHVSLGGFDTHAGQLNTHSTLLRYVSEGISTFLEDLGADGLSERVLVMSFSEFGRRVAQNGSAGTDHGTAAPLFLFGPAVKGGFFGSGPNLANLTSGGNLQHETDFRSVYGSVLNQWFGMTPDDTTAILGGAFPTLDLVQSATGTSVSNDPVLPDMISLSKPFPNPVRGTTEFSYNLGSGADARLEVFDMLGRRVRSLDLGYQRAGLGSVRIDATGLPPGGYVARLSSGSQSVASSLIVAR